ncbi:hypothetical protein FKM82_006471 [Ascaphus truei]
MKTLTAVVLSLLLFCPGEMKEWPEHTLCNMKDFEAYYKSCDPFQDFGFSIEPCGKYMPSPVIMKIAFLLRRDINELFFHSKIYLNGNHFLSYEAPMCEKTVPHFTFCGKKKGDVSRLFLMPRSLATDGPHCSCMLPRH